MRLFTLFTLQTLCAEDHHRSKFTGNRRSISVIMNAWIMCWQSDFVCAVHVAKSERDCAWRVRGGCGCSYWLARFAGTETGIWTWWLRFRRVRRYLEIGGDKRRVLSRTLGLGVSWRRNWIAKESRTFDGNREHSAPLVA